jgi:hypothetical protein
MIYTLLNVDLQVGFPRLGLLVPGVGALTHRSGHRGLPIALIV